MSHPASSQGITHCGSRRVAAEHAADEAEIVAEQTRQRELSAHVLGGGGSERGATLRRLERNALTSMLPTPLACAR